MAAVRYPFSHSFRVAWGDMDALGHVNNVAFNRYFETARAEFFFGKLGEKPAARRTETGPVITSVAMQYRRQVHFPATLEATVGVLEVSARTFGLGCTIWEGPVCVAGGKSQHIWLDFGTGRPTRMPPDFWQLLEQEKVADRD